MNWLISIGAVYGAMFLCMALYSLAKLRGRPVLLDHRWLSVPGTWFALFYFWIEYSTNHWERLGMGDRTGFLVGGLVATVGMLGAFRVFPTHWVGLVVLGVRRSEVHQVIKHALRELDPGARLKREQWYSDAFNAEVTTSEILGQFILRIRFSGAGAGELSRDMLPTLQHDFADLEIDAGDDAVAFARRVLLIFIALVIGLAFLAGLVFLIWPFLR